MTFEIINNITQGSRVEHKKSLIYGYIKSLTEEEIVDLMIEYALDKSYSTYIFRRVKELENDVYVNKLAMHFLSCCLKSTNYKEIKRYSYYLSHLVDRCDQQNKIKILRYFLNSGKRYIRKYAYATDLEHTGLFQIAWELINDNPDEATFLIKEIAYHYSDKFINEYFSKLITHPGVEEYQVRKLFSRYPSLNDENWLWLKRHYPHSALYVASIKEYILTDAECVKLLDSQYSDEFNSDKQGPDKGLLLWCLAKMRKWEVTRQILVEEASIRAA